MARYVPAYAIPPCFVAHPLPPCRTRAMVLFRGRAGRLHSDRYELAADHAGEGDVARQRSSSLG